MALPGSNGSMKVFLPVNYKAEQKWPVLFFYHGMGGSPDTSVLRRFTDGSNYIVVGMPYIEGDRSRTAQEMEAYMRRELANFQLARNWIVAHASVDESRIFMSGASKGGWTTTGLAEMASSQVAGMVVLLAGRNAGPSRSSVIPGVQNKPIYIGDGELDLNLVAAVRARELYRKNGASVTFEEYAGIGHEMPKEARRLREWLRIQAIPRQGNNRDNARKEWSAATEAELNAARAESDPLVKYERVRDLSDSPGLGLCDKAVAEQVKGLFATLAKTSPGKEERDAELRFGDVTCREAGMQSLAEMQAVVEGYRELTKLRPGTRYGKLAAMYLPKIEDAYRKSVDATAKANQGRTSAPTNTPTRITPSFPVDGVRRGNTVTFGK